MSATSMPVTPRRSTWRIGISWIAPTRMSFCTVTITSHQHVIGVYLRVHNNACTTETSNQ